MKFETKAFRNGMMPGYGIKDLTKGQLLAIRNGLGYAVRAGIVTPVQQDVFEAVGRYLNEIGEPVEEIKTDTEGFLKDHFGITIPDSEPRDNG